MLDPNTIPIEWFWSKVDRSGGPGACWPWTKCCAGGGYGFISLTKAGERQYGVAHRVAYALTYPNVDISRLFICHHCDNPPCCNPAHLFAGTLSDNMRDCARKGRIANQQHPERARRGERHPKAKLSEQDVRDVRLIHASGRVTGRALARLYGVSHTAMLNVLRGRHWKHI